MWSNCLKTEHLSEMAYPECTMTEHLWSLNGLKLLPYSYEGLLRALNPDSPKKHLLNTDYVPGSVHWEPHRRTKNPTSKELQV
jgi:hypothetical protein